jgi:CheY-like chemotaxis protein
MNNVEYQLDKYILIVEDNGDTVLYLTSILKKFGINKILKSGNGENGIKLFKKHKNDIFLVLMDLRLPDESGYEIIPKLLNIKKVNIVVQSANTFNDDKIKAFNLGCVDYLTKPYTQDQIKTSLNKYYSK